MSFEMGRNAEPAVQTSASNEAIYYDQIAERLAAEKAKDYTEKGLKADFGCIAPYTIYEIHSHDEDKYLYTADGSLKMRINGGEWFELGPDQEAFMPAGTPHEAQVGEKPWWYANGIAS